MAITTMQTVTYSRVGDVDIKFDIEPPPSPTTGTLPAVIYIHGGGLVSGSRRDAFFPDWFRGALSASKYYHRSSPVPLLLTDGVHKRGLIFITADHRLTYPSTGLDIIDDVKALFAFLAKPDFSEKHLPSTLSLDASRIAIMGLSGGGYAARAAGLYAQPRPRAVFSLYGMGGEFLSDHWIAEKTKPMEWPGAEHATAEALAHLLANPPGVASELPLRIKSLETFSAADDEGRTNLFLYWWRTGELLDYVLNEPGLSAKLRALPPAERLAAVPEHLRPFVPEANIDASFPPTVLVHGLADPIVLLSESQATHDRLKELGVRSELLTVPDALHGLFLDLTTMRLAPGAEEAWERAIDFLAEELGRT